MDLETIHTLTLTTKTEGTDKAVSAAMRLQDAQEKLAAGAEKIIQTDRKSEKSKISVANAIHRYRMANDAAYKTDLEFARATQLVVDALEQEKVGAAWATKEILRLNDAYDAARSSANGALRAQEALSDQIQETAVQARIAATTGLVSKQTLRDVPYMLSALAQQHDAYEANIKVQEEQARVRREAAAEAARQATQERARQDIVRRELQETAAVAKRTSLDRRLGVTIEAPDPRTISAVLSALAAQGEAYEKELDRQADARVAAVREATRREIAAREAGAEAVERRAAAFQARLNRVLGVDTPSIDPKAATGLLASLAAQGAAYEAAMSQQAHDREAAVRAATLREIAIREADAERIAASAAAAQARINQVTGVAIEKADDRVIAQMLASLAAQGEAFERGMAEQAAERVTAVQLAAQREIAARDAAAAEIERRSAAFQNRLNATLGVTRIEADPRETALMLERLEAQVEAREQAIAEGARREIAAREEAGEQLARAQAAIQARIAAVTRTDLGQAEPQSTAYMLSSLAQQGDRYEQDLKKRAEDAEMLKDMERDLAKARQDRADSDSKAMAIIQANAERENAIRDELLQHIDAEGQARVRAAQAAQLYQTMLKDGVITLEQYDRAIQNVDRIVANQSKGIGQIGQTLGNLGYQINDVATGLLTGQSPFMIMAQQGPQVVQILGDAPGGLTNVLRGIGTGFKNLVAPITAFGASVAAATAGSNLLIAGMGAAVGALLTPWGLVITAVVAATAALFAYLSRAKEIESLQDTLKRHGDLIKSLGEAYGQASAGMEQYAKRSANVLEAQLAATTARLRKAMEESAKELSALNQPGTAMDPMGGTTGFADPTPVITKYQAFAEAFDHLQKSAAQGGPDFRAFEESVASTMKRMGNTEEARRLGEELLKLSKEGFDLQTAMFAASNGIQSMSASARAAIADVDKVRQGMAALDKIAFKETDRQQVDRIFKEEMERARGNIRLQEELMAKREEALGRIQQVEDEAAEKEAERNRKRAEAQEARFTAYERAVKTIQDENIELDKQAELIGKSQEEVYRLEAAHKLERAAIATNTVVTAEQRKEIDALAAAHARKKAEIDRATEAYQEMLAAQKQMADQFSDMIANMISGTSTLNDSLKSIGQSLLKSGVSGLLTGSGALGSTLGLNAPNGQVGGLLGLSTTDFFKNMKDSVSSGTEGGLKTFTSAVSSGDATGALSAIGGGSAVKGALGVGGAALGGYGVGYSSGSATMGVLGGAMAGASAGAMTGTPVGIIAGAVIGGVAGLIGANSAASDKAEEKRQNARESLRTNEAMIDAMRRSWTGEGIGSVGLFEAEQRPEMMKLKDTYIDAGRRGEAKEVAEDYREGLERAKDDFRRTYSGLIEALESGLGPNSPFFQAQQAIMGIRETLQGFIADAQATGRSVRETRNASIDYALSLMQTTPQLSMVQSRMAEIQGAAAGLRTVLVDLGMEAEEAGEAIRDGIKEAMREVRENFAADLKARLNAATGKGYINDIADALEQFKIDAVDTHELGMNPNLARDVFRAEVTEIVKGAELSAEALADLRKQFPWLDAALLKTFETIENGLSDLRNSLRDWVNSVKQGAQSPLSPGDRFAAAADVYNRTITVARAGTGQAQADALGALPNAASTLLEAAQGMYASGPQYVSIFNEVTAAVEALSREPQTDPVVDRLDLVNQNLIAVNGSIVAGHAILYGQNGLLTGVNAGVGGVNQNLNGVNGLLGGVYAGVNGVNAGLGGVNANVGGVNANLASSNQTLAEIERTAINDANLNAEANNRIAQLDQNQQNIANNEAANENAIDARNDNRTNITRAWMRNDTDRVVNRLDSGFDRMVGALNGLPRRAKGGRLTGRGGPKDDANLFRGSPGEFVVNAEATRRNGPLIEAINDGSLERQQRQAAEQAQRQAAEQAQRQAREAAERENQRQEAQRQAQRQAEQQAREAAERENRRQEAQREAERQAREANEREARRQEAQREAERQAERTARAAQAAREAQAAQRAREEQEERVKRAADSARVAETARAEEAARRAREREVVRREEADRAARAARVAAPPEPRGMGPAPRVDGPRHSTPAPVADRPGPRHSPPANENIRDPAVVRMPADTPRPVTRAVNRVEGMMQERGARPEAIERTARTLRDADLTRRQSQELLAQATAARNARGIMQAVASVRRPDAAVRNPGAPVTGTGGAGVRTGRPEGPRHSSPIPAPTTRSAPQLDLPANVRKEIVQTSTRMEGVFVDAGFSPADIAAHLGVIATAGLSLDDNQALYRVLKDVGGRKRITEVVEKLNPFRIAGEFVDYFSGPGDTESPLTSDQRSSYRSGEPLTVGISDGLSVTMASPPEHRDMASVEVAPDTNVTVPASLDPGIPNKGGSYTPAGVIGPDSWSPSEQKAAEDAERAMINDQIEQAWTEQMLEQAQLDRAGLNRVQGWNPYEGVPMGGGRNQFGPGSMIGPAPDGFFGSTFGPQTGRNVTGLSQDIMNEVRAGTYHADLFGGFSPFGGMGGVASGFKGYSGDIPADAFNNVNFGFFDGEVFGPSVLGDAKTPGGFSSGPFGPSPTGFGGTTTNPAPGVDGFNQFPGFDTTISGISGGFQRGGFGGIGMGVDGFGGAFARDNWSEPTVLGPALHDALTTVTAPSAGYGTGPFNYGGYGAYNFAGYDQLGQPISARESISPANYAAAAAALVDSGWVPDKASAVDIGSYVDAVLDNWGREDMTAAQEAAAAKGLAAAIQQEIAAERTSVSHGTFAPTTTGVKGLGPDVTGAGRGVRGGHGLLGAGINAVSPAITTPSETGGSSLSQAIQNATNALNSSYGTISGALDRGAEALMSGYASGAYGSVAGMGTSFAGSAVTTSEGGGGNSVADSVQSATDSMNDSYGNISDALGFAGGGWVSGPGTSTSDSIPARLSDEEYVVRANQAAQHGPLLESINRGAYYPGNDNDIDLSPVVAAIQAMHYALAGLPGEVKAVREEMKGLREDQKRMNKSLELIVDGRATANRRAG